MKKFWIASAILAATSILPLRAAAQALPNQVLALYPKEAGEITFLDVRTLRNSPNYAQIKKQVLPERFRQMSEWTKQIGIDFDNEVYQLSWAFLPAAQGGPVGLAGIAEGNFPTDEIQRLIKERKFPSTRQGENLILSLGKNDQGQEFVFAFLDPSTAAFGFRSIVLEMVDRRANGGASVLDNRSVADLVSQVNGRAPVWITMDSHFTLLAVKQMLPDIAQVPGFETLASRLQTSTLQFQLSDSFRGQAAVRCQTGSDAMVVAKLMQAAVTYQAFRLNDTNPELARLLNDVRLSQTDDRVEAALAIGAADLATLIQKNSLALKF